MRRALWLGGALLAYSALAVYVFRSALGTGSSAWIGGPGDAEIMMWYLAWNPFALLHHHDPLLTTYIHYPVVLNTLWNPSLVFPSLVAAPLTLVAGPIVSYNLLATAAFPLAAWLAMLALLRFVDNPLPAFAGGLLYGFSPYMFAHQGGHLPLILAAAFPPVMLIAWHEILVRQRWAWPWPGFLLGFSAVALLLTAEEVLAVAAVISACGFVLLLALSRRRQIRERWPRAASELTVALITFVLLAAVPLYFELRGPGRLTGFVQAPNTYVSDLLAFVTPPSGLVFSTSRAAAVVAQFTGNGAENNAYVGVPLLLLLLLAVVLLRRRREMWWAALAFLGTALLSMGPSLHLGGRDTLLRLPWRYIAKLPLMQNVLPSRMMVFGYLFLALVLGLLVDAGLRRREAPLRVATVAAAGLALLPLLQPGGFTTTADPVPAFFTTSAERAIPDGSVVVLGPASGARGMRWQAAGGLRFRQPGGLGFFPPNTFGAPSSPLVDALTQIELGRPAPALTPAERSALLADLRALGASAVIVGPTQTAGVLPTAPASAEAIEVAFFTDLLGRAPEQEGGVYVWWHP
ncbi:MAG TPA: hypothetical protein VF137_08325 [Candidatus Dormibacteraeota bacterium]